MSVLFGRDAEAAEIDRLLARTRDAHGGVLVVVGEAGIGKSALLEYSEQTAEGFRTLHAVGVESEAELPYAGLHALLRPLLPLIDELPDVQARALRGAFGLAEGESADRFLIGSAVLALLSEASEERRLLCLVDDLQSFDSASTDALLFAVRRFQVEQVAVVLAAREQAASRTRGLPELRLGPLDEAASRAILEASAIELSRVETARVISEAGGNPLALRQLAGPMARDSSVPGSFARYDGAPTPVPRRVEALFADRIRVLPERTRNALLVAAVDGTADVAVISRAMAAFGASVADFAPAEADRLVYVVGTRVTFEHPLVRSAVYQSAPFHARLTAHRALADALDGDRDTDRRAWHLASGTTEADEKVASELVLTAENARRRGGYAAVAAAYERAAELTPDAADRAGRMMLAARAAFVAGDRPWARRLVDRVDQGHLDPRTRAFLLDLGAALIWHEEQQRALAITLDAASDVAPYSPDTAARLYFEAVVPDWVGGDAVSTAESAARLAALGLECSDAGRPFATAVFALGRLAAGDAAGCVAELAGIGEWLGQSSSDLSVSDRVLDRTFGPYLALLLGDPKAIRRSSAAVVDLCRVSGAVEALPSALTTYAMAMRLVGQFREARAAAVEVLRWSEELGNDLDVARIKAEQACLAAVAGDVDRCETLAGEAAATGSASTVASASCHLGLLDLSLGRYEHARSHLESAVHGPASHTVPVLFALPDLVEVAVALDDPELGSAVHNRYWSWAEATGQPWAYAVVFRCRALLAEPQAAAELWERSVELGRSAGSPFEHARTELLYGSWLRRRRQVVESRSHLRSATAAFERMGAVPWADRAHTELRASGERTNDRPAANVLDSLTPQELQVSRLAAKGLSNKEIGLRLFLSPRTIGYHLYKIFPKLGVGSRTEMAALMRDEDVVPVD